MKVIDFEQGTPEWRAARAGLVTASRMCDVTAKIKSGEAAARRDYRAQIVAETLTGEPQERAFMNDEMRWGVENEPMAVAAVEMALNVLTDTVGLVIHPTIERAGASPDRLIGADGVLEVKCPKTATHLQYLMDGVLPKDYEPQVMWQLACTGRKWAEFASYDPRLPADLQLFRIRVQRNDARIAELEREVLALLEDVDKMLGTIRMFSAKAAA